MKILIADTAWVSQQRLTKMVETLEAEAVIFQASDMVGLCRILDHHADMTLVFIDHSLSGDGDEEQLFTLIRDAAPDADIVLWTKETDRDRYMKAIYLGAVGILLKTDPDDQIAAALRLLFSGQCAFPRKILTLGPRERAEPSTLQEEENLTPREREVLDAIGHGQTVARIAETLAVSPHTVRVHVTRIMKKLDLHDRSSLLYYAIKRPRRPASLDAPNDQQGVFRSRTG